uniref:head-tail adaptor protein n=1 Tax=Stutzerimonas stutzeri TaxID=316 RepID=UPI003C7A9607
MNTGRRRHPVEVQAYTSTQDPVTGEMVQSWTTIGTEWASIEGINGREFLAADAQQSAT